MARSHPIPKRLLRPVAAKCCPSTGCLHEDKWHCGAFGDTEAVLKAVPDGWAKVDGKWVRLVRATAATHAPLFCIGEQRGGRAWQDNLAGADQHE